VPEIGPFDVALVVVVSVQATTLAYIHRPRWKAFVLVLPVPFTLATLALGRDVDATNVLGIVLLIGFTQAVRALHCRVHLAIVPSIAFSAAGYALVGAGLGLVVPDGDGAFWTAAAGVFALALVLFALIGHREEPGHVSPLAKWKKFLAVAGIVCCLVVAKNALKGFMTVFPMVGTVAAYEARHSLWTIGRQIPVFALAAVPMMATVRLMQGALGLAGALAVGWVVFLAVLVPASALLWCRERASGAGPAPETLE
jgi:hypothetical protein